MYYKAHTQLCKHIAPLRTFYSDVKLRKVLVDNEF